MRGTPLTSGQQCFWRVRIWDGAGQPSPWSKTARGKWGCMQTSAPQARWIGVPWEEDTSRSQPVPYLRTEFDVPQAAGSFADGTAASPVLSARLYVTSLGLYSATINGRPVTENLFTPGWTSSPPPAVPDL